MVSISGGVLVAGSEAVSAFDISVVIPTRNSERFVVDAVRSVRAQTVLGARIEVVIVDDASEDGTVDQIEKASLDVTVIQLNERVERGAARNIGARSARGELLAFLDSDDLWLPQKLEVQLARFDGSPSVTGALFVNETVQMVLKIHRPKEGAQDRLSRENSLLGAPSSLVINRTAFLATGGFPEELDLQGSEDWLYLLQLRARGPLAIVSRPLIAYRVHRGNSSGSLPDVARSMWAAVIEAERSKLVPASKVRGLRAFTAETIARGFAHVGQPGEAVSWLRRAAQEGTPFAGAVAAGRVCGGIASRIFRGARIPPPNAT